MKQDYDISIKDLSVSYGSVVALKNISFNIEPKSFLGIIGPNGGGKSTLIKALLGLKKPDSGRIEVKQGKKIGYVPQFAEFDQRFPISVNEVIMSGVIKGKKLTFKKYSKEEVEYAESLMKRMDILDLKDKQIGELSGGQLQKVLVTRSMVSKPDILVLDEPTASLDVKVKNEIYDILKCLSEDITILIITHDIAEIFSYVSSVAYINQTLHYHGSDSKMRKNVLELTTGCPIEDLMINEEALKKEFMETEDKYHDQRHH
ncbi:ABC transporter ATP-binding protein [Acidaminobacter sp. JC074]|uniref:metal ABC transporter ATP-binding protein n=1 Tax=Acidaminobacter sp. JC074 TaxID=2530199 RepID=UPI001F0F353C|nr:ABC transporter ATP-binding protein [Acidaminobacter sp. JC074]MCH4885939.1 ABC transporter ATP-binding protein [Acidaminobacter sp. JC074]